MLQYIIKLIVSAGLITLVSELAKRNTFMASMTAALPLTSLLVIFWIYFESGDTVKIADFSMGVFWLVIPSLLFFVLLAATLKRGLPFIPSMLISSAATVATYFAYCKILLKFGVRM